MGIEVGTALVISAVVSGVGAIMQYQAQKKAQKKQAQLAAESRAAQQRAEAAQRRAADLAAARRRRDLVRQARIRRAAAIQSGISAGAGFQSSPVLGAAGAVGSDVSSTISFLDQTRALNRLAQTEFGRARDIAATPVTVNGFGSLISTIGGAGLQLAGSKYGARIFDGGGTTPRPSGWNRSPF